MNITQKFFLDLLISYINGSVLELPEGIDWEEVRYLAKIHNVEIIVYISITRMNILTPISDELKTKFLAAFITNTQQVNMAKKIFELFEKNDIDYMPFKGFVVREFYPDKEARSFGDIDIWIKEADRQKSDVVLKNNDFLYNADMMSSDVWTYNKGIVQFEIHTKILYDKLFNDFDYISYFEDKVKQRKCINGHMYTMKEEDHFLYLLVHLAKHFYHEGAGIRMFMDLVLFKRYYGDSMSFDYIYQETEKIELKSFTDVVFNICNHLLGSDFECSSIEEKKLSLITAYVLKHGVFGLNEQNIHDIALNMDMKPRQQVLKERMFPSYEYMKNHFDWFRNGKKYQLLYAWIRRAIWHMSNKKNRVEIKSKMIAIVNPGEDAITHFKMLKIMGLK